MTEKERQERLAAIWDELVLAARTVVAEHEVTEAELHFAAAFMTGLAAQGHLEDLFDLMAQTAAREFRSAYDRNLNANLEGPLYKPGSPIRPDGVLYEREPGPEDQRLTVRGRVYDRRTGAGVPGAQIDVWQADRHGDYDLEGYHLRGRVVTDGDGAYTLHTVVPGIYPVHVDDKVAELFEAMGRHAYRSAHIHLKVWVDGEVVLTTQFFDAESVYLDTDILQGVVRPDLVVQRHPVTGSDGARRAEMTFDIPLAAG